MGGTRGVTDGKWDGGVGRAIDDSAPKLPVTIRWDSALPVRQALLRLRSGEHLSGSQDVKGKLDKSPNDPQKDYIITVIGLLTNHETRDRERLRKELIGDARLMRTGKAALMPENVVPDTSAGAIQLFFPRTDPIRLTDKEVTFDMQFGSIRVEKNFRLKAMIYKGKLEL